MYIVYFQNSYGVRREIGAASTYSGAMTVISDFLKKFNFKSYYWRTTDYEHETEIDVGSWSEFFYIRKEEI